MFRKSILLALAATAALGVALVTGDQASAKPHGHGARGHHGHGHHGHHGRGHRHGHRHHHDRRHWHVRWHRNYHVRPYYYAVNPVLPGPCTCLSKEYTQEGAVLFKDRCTNEMAMNPPLVAPQQTGALEPQYTPQYPPQAPVAR